MPPQSQYPPITFTSRPAHFGRPPGNAQTTTRVRLRTDCSLHALSVNLCLHARPGPNAAAPNPWPTLGPGLSLTLCALAPAAAPLLSQRVPAPILHPTLGPRLSLTLCALAPPGLSLTLCALAPAAAPLLSQRVPAPILHPTLGQRLSLTLCALAPPGLSLTLCALAPWPPQVCR